MKALHLLLCTVFICVPVFGMSEQLARLKMEDVETRLLGGAMTEEEEISVDMCETGCRLGCGFVCGLGGHCRGYNGCCGVMAGALVGTVCGRACGLVRVWCNREPVEENKKND
jgi:hypothetical protein